MRGAREIMVRRGDRDVTAEIVAFDPDLDLAYLAIPSGDERTTPIDGDGVEPGARAVIWVVRDGDPTPLPATVRRRVRIDTEDIYVDGETSRPGFELDATIEPGDSGAAVLIDGAVAGVVWARSRTSGGRAWAIDPDRGGERIGEQLTSGHLGDDVDLTRCR